MLRHKILRRYLIRNSFLLFSIYMLSSIMIISIYDSSTWSGAVIRAISVGVFSLMIFFINAHIINYFKGFDSKKKATKNVEKKIFVCGYIWTVIIFSAQHILTRYLAGRGVEMHLPKSVEDATGWKIALFIMYVSLVQYTFIYLIQHLTLSQYEKNRIELELLRLKASNTENTNQLLKQQIQPHFLFNALNTLKSLIKKRPGTAEDYLIRLSDFLRASFANTASGSGLSTIDEELKICENYMEMQKVRFGDALHYTVDASVGLMGPKQRIPVFSLQPLLENAIKHNIATIEKPLYISIKKEGNYITVRNNLQHKSSMETSTGNGLSNLRERYRILSGDDVLINSNNDHFVVSIKILNK